MRRSRGSRSKTRYKLKTTTRVGRTNPITKKMQNIRRKRFSAYHNRSQCT